MPSQGTIGCFPWHGATFLSPVRRKLACRHGGPAEALRLGEAWALAWAWAWAWATLLSEEITDTSSSSSISGLVSA